MWRRASFPLTKRPIKGVVERQRRRRARGNGNYSSIVSAMKRRYSVRVRRWRGNMSGCAWRVYHANGRVTNWVESPLPRTPISLALFLHEVGHHVIGFETYKRRCEEEYHAWRWALREMRRMGVRPDGRTMRRFDASMEYAVGKAVRRGLRNIPAKLVRFSPRTP